ncbi:MAG: Minf_1886 family protein [Gemmataceae bacterium]
MDAKIWEMVRDDHRYAYEAYEFVCEAVTFTQERNPRGRKRATEQHISGEQLSRGTCELAIREFGMMAAIVFQQWGIRSTEDIGEIVFRLIRIERLSQSDDDDIRDFENLFDIPTTLREGFEFSAAEYTPVPRRGER